MFYRMEAVQSAKEKHGSTFDCALLRHRRRCIQPTLKISKLLRFYSNSENLKTNSSFRKKQKQIFRIFSYQLFGYIEPFRTKAKITAKHFQYVNMNVLEVKQFHLLR